MATTGSDREPTTYSDTEILCMCDVIYECSLDNYLLFKTSPVFVKIYKFVKMHLIGFPIEIHLDDARPYTRVIFGILISKILGLGPSAKIAIYISPVWCNISITSTLLCSGTLR